MTNRLQGRVDVHGDGLSGDTREGRGKDSGERNRLKGHGGGKV